MQAPRSVTGGGILVWVGVYGVTGMESEKGEALWIYSARR